MSSRNINGLTVKQQVFCDLYRASDDEEIRGNAKRCYMIAFDAKEISAEANGPRLLKDPHVIEYLEQKRQQAEEEADISEARILNEMACLAFLDPADFYDENGDLKNIHEMPEHARRALAGMKINVVLADKDKKSVITSKEIKYNDKKPALEILMKYKGMLTEKVEHSGGVGGVLLVPNDVSPEEWQKQNSPSQT